MIKRVAFTLVELCISMTAGSALMVLAIGMLHQSMTLASTARERSDHDRALRRLAQDFRHDVHRAEKCLVSSVQMIQLVMPDDSEITYDMELSRITRRQQVDDSRSRHESYDLSTASASFESLSEPARAVLTVIRRPHPSSDQTRVERRVEAVVGRLTSHQNAEISP